MSYTALSCLQCGAPLPAQTASREHIQCASCRVTLLRDGAATAPAEPPSWDGAVERCLEAVKGSRGEDWLVLLERVSREQPGPMGEPLALAESATIERPFLTADASGPRHCSRSVTARELAALAAKPPAVTEGFFSRLFGS